MSLGSHPPSRTAAGPPSQQRAIPWPGLQPWAPRALQSIPSLGQLSLTAGTTLVCPLLGSPGRRSPPARTKSISQPLWLWAVFTQHPGKRERGAGGVSGKQGVPSRTHRVGSASVTALVCLSAGWGDLSGDLSIWGGGEAREGQGWVSREVQGRDMQLHQAREWAPPLAEDGGGGRSRTRPGQAGSRPLSSHSTPPPPLPRGGAPMCIVL